MTGSIGNALAVLSFDEDYQKVSAVALPFSGSTHSLTECSRWTKWGCLISAWSACSDKFVSSALSPLPCPPPPPHPPTHTHTSFSELQLKIWIPLYAKIKWKNNAAIEDWNSSVGHVKWKNNRAGPCSVKRIQSIVQTVCVCDPETVLVNKLKIRTQTSLAEQYHSFLCTAFTNTPRSAVVICTQPQVSNYHRLDCFDTGLSYHRIPFAVHITSVHCFDDRNEGHVCSSDHAICLPAWLKPVAHWSWG